MLVFIDVPLNTSNARKSFVDALGDESVAWLGHNMTLDDLAAPKRLRNYRVVGGHFTLAQARRFTGNAVFASIVNEPSVRVMCHWTAVIHNSDHHFHEAAYTFQMRELFEEKHPFAKEMSNVATQFLGIDDGKTLTARAALASITERHFIIGESEYARQFASAVGRFLGLGRDAIDETGFHAPPGTKPQGEMRRVARQANKDDSKLYNDLVAMRVGGRKVIRSFGKNTGGPQPA